jgi:hypothetical protein
MHELSSQPQKQILDCEIYTIHPNLHAFFRITNNTTYPSSFVQTQQVQRGSECLGVIGMRTTRDLFNCS